MAKQVTRWLAEDGSVHETQSQAEYHDLNLRVKREVGKLLQAHIGFTEQQKEAITKWIALKRTDLLIALMGEDPRKPQDPEAP